MSKKAYFLLAGALILALGTADAGIALHPGSLQPNASRRANQIKMPSKKELEQRQRHLKEEHDKAIRRANKSARNALNEIDAKLDAVVKGGGMGRREAEELKRQCHDEAERQMPPSNMSKLNGQSCKDKL